MNKVIPSAGLGLLLALSVPLTLHADLGPYPEQISAWSAAIKQSQREAGVELIKTLQAAAARGDKQIQIPKGDYRFANVAPGGQKAHVILGPEFRNVTIDFQGSSFWFETEETGILISEASNVTLRGLFLDWDPLPFIQGAIVRISPADGTLDIKLDPGYDKAVASLMAESWRGRGIAFDAKTRELKSEQHGCEVTFSWGMRQPDGSYRIKYHGYYGSSLADSGFGVGDPFAMLLRLRRAVRIEKSENTLLEDVTLYSAPFIGFVSSSGGGTVFRRCAIVRRPGTNRLIGGNADGFNCDNMKKGPLIEDCRIDTIGDDFVNVHGHLARVLTQEKPTQIITSRLNRRKEITTPVTVEFLDRKTMLSLGKRQATATAVKDWKIDQANTLANLDQKWASGDASQLAYGKTVAAHRLSLDQPIALEGDVIVLCEELSSPGAVVRNNAFKGSLARGLRMQAPHIVVENNTISITHGAGMTMVGHASYWGEGPYVYDAIVRNNTFIDTATGQSARGQRASLIVEEKGANSQRLNRDIRIEDNTFLRSGGAAIVARNLDHSTIVGNNVDGFALYPNYSSGRSNDTPTGLGAAIVVEDSNDTRLENNSIENPGPFAIGPAILNITPTE